MCLWLAQAVLAALACLLLPVRCLEISPEFSSETPVNNVVQDPRTGRVYLGAVNAIYQLDSSLSLEVKAETGPKKDRRSCIPPIHTNCDDPKDMNNTNKLLLVNPSNDSLIVCGSVYRGICSLVSLRNISDEIYYSDNKGEKTYVASIEDSVSVVAVMSSIVIEEPSKRTKQNFTVFVVGKGYGSQDSLKLISTRILQNYGEWVVFESVIDASAVQSIPFVSKYLHDFRYTFKDHGFIYFLFSRTMGENDNKNFTFVSRLCEQDSGYYSYTELQLNCGSRYRKAQAGFVASPGKELARSMTETGQYGSVLSWDKVLFLVASTDEDNPESALCMFPLSKINEKILEITSACYSDSGKINGKPVVYVPYSSKTVDCGGDFLPSPLASKPEFALKAEPVYTRKGLLTAVAVAVENDNTIAFLGSSNGEIFKLHLSGNPEIYKRSTAGDRVNKNLFFDTSMTHLYVTTVKKITKVRVQSCHLKNDCQSCVALKDPYCGWCVMEGRCTRRSDCRRAEEKNGWLWSPNQQCVKIVSFHPPNLSCKKTQQVDINIPSLPSISPSDQLLCRFGTSETKAVMISSRVTCIQSPNPAAIPPTPEHEDFVSVPVKVFVNGSVELASGEYKFYNCAAAAHKVENTPCMSCVSRGWACEWNSKAHTCDDMTESSGDLNVIKHRQGANCPRFENPDPDLIPVGYKIPISFEGFDLEPYKSHEFTIGTGLMGQTEEDVVKEPGPRFYSFLGYEFSYDQSHETSVLFHVKDKQTGRKIDSLLNVTLYNCSQGREDCSLCKNADPKYNCVWCSKKNACVYSGLCDFREPQQCPDPKITDIIPRYGPLKGGIAITIKGSNLGIHREDIKSISVAGVPCVHQPERYAVSTSVVCQIGPVDPSSRYTGTVEVELEGGRRGSSSVYFTYRVTEHGGPVEAGDYVATPFCTHLIQTCRLPCRKDFSGQITCKTGEYRGEKVPSDALPVTVKYGKHTSTEVPGAFQYSENPTISNHNPKGSFICGGRKIVVTGSGFDLIQEASIKVNISAEGTSHSDPVEVCVQETRGKNDTQLEFLSPEVHIEHDSPAYRTFLHLDNMVVELKPFHYHPNPTFSMDGQGFSKAMTAKEAQAFVGDVPCVVNTLQDDKLFLDPPNRAPTARSRMHRRDVTSEPLDLMVKFGNGEWLVGSVHYERKYEVPLPIIIPAVIVPMLLIVTISVYCYRRKSQQAEREYEKVKHQLENLEESVRDRCKKEFTDLMIEMEDHTNDISEGRIPFLDYKNYTDRVFFLPSKDGANDVMITGKLDIPESRRAVVTQALNQFSNLLNSKTFLINFIRTLEARSDFNARAKVYFASLLTVALHGKLEYYTDIMRTLLLSLMEDYVRSKNPKLMLRRSETVVERMLCNWMSICLYQFLKDTAGEPLYKLFRAIKHQIEKGPVDAQVKKAKYTLNDTGLLGDDVEYSVLTLQVLVLGEGPDITPVKVLNCDTISQVKEKIIDQVYKNLPYSQRPKVDSVTLEWRPGSTGQILSDLDVTSQKEGRWRHINTLAHYNVRDNATLVLSRVRHTQQSYDQAQESHEERNALLDDDKVFHLVRPMDELEEMKSNRSSLKDKSMTKAITEIYLTRLLSVKGTLQQFVDDFFRSVLSLGVPPAVKYFFDFLDEQALKHDNVDEETIHIWKTNSLPLRFWVNILKNPHFIFDVHTTEVIDASLSVIAQTFMDACTKSEHKLSRDSPSNKLLYAKEISTYKKMVDEYYKGIREMVSVSDQDMNTHLAEVSRAHTDRLNTQVALHQLYQYASKYYDGIITSLDEDPAAQSKQLTLRLQQIAAVLENKVTDL
uniref:Sema domain-containing protein n=1 Tax=Denticeps clupeoides TaxID=299321 RepID=A0AAY4E5Q6_9TELE